MTPAQLRRNVVQGTLSSYRRIVARIALGLVTFRLLYQELDPESFGFWSLLWSIFGFASLLDFGFGPATQKVVAELSIARDWDRLGRTLGTLFCGYLAAAAIATAAGLLLAAPLVDLFGVSPPRRDEFVLVLRLFLIGAGIAFALGFFLELLQGQQRVATANNVALAVVLANFLGVAAAVHWHLPLRHLVVIALLCVIVPYGVAAWLALRHLPEVRLHPFLFSPATLRDHRRFGLVVYLHQLGTLVREKANPPLVGALLGASAVTPFQAGGKVAEMFALLTRQIADVLSPTAAYLHARGDAAALRAMLDAGLRFASLAATPLFVATALYMDALVRLVTGEPHPSRDMILAGELLLLAAYSQTLTHGVFKRMYLMAGQERRLMIAGVLESLVHLALAVAFASSLHSHLGVALATVLASLALGWGLLWSWIAREIGVTRRRLFVRAVLRPWAACLPMIAVGASFRLQPWWTSGASLTALALEAVLLGVTALAGLWRFGLDPAERRVWAERWSPDPR